MPRKNIRPPGIRAVIAEGASCLWPRCPELHKRGHLMCMPHWCRLPRRLRDALRDAAAEGRDSAAYRESLAAIVDEARRQDIEIQAGAA